jgi:hypothetical protein
MRSVETGQLLSSIFTTPDTVGAVHTVDRFWEHIEEDNRYFDGYILDMIGLRWLALSTRKVAGWRTPRR